MDSSCEMVFSTMAYSITAPICLRCNEDLNTSLVTTTPAANPTFLRHLRAVRPVEPFNKRVLGRVARSDELPLHRMPVTFPPQCYRFKRECFHHMIT